MAANAAEFEHAMQSRQSAAQFQQEMGQMMQPMTEPSKKKKTKGRKNLQSSQRGGAEGKPGPSMQKGNSQSGDPVRFGQR